MTAITLEKNSPTFGERLEPEHSPEIAVKSDDKSEVLINPENISRKGLSEVIDDVKELMTKLGNGREKKKSGGGSFWWFSPCGEHSSARYVCCIGGKCESWKKD